MLVSETGIVSKCRILDPVPPAQRPSETPIQQIQMCRLLFNAVKRHPKSSLHIAKERINQIMSNPTYTCFIRAKQEHDTGYAQAFCGSGRQQGGISTLGQNNRHEMQGIKSVFQTARRFRAHTTCPYMNVLKTIRELK